MEEAKQATVGGPDHNTTVGLANIKDQEGGMLGHPGDAAVNHKSVGSARGLNQSQLANGGLSISLLKLGQASRDRADPAFGHLFESSASTEAWPDRADPQEEEQ